MSVHLTLSCDNRDLTRALLNGDVEPRGIDLTTIPYSPPPKRHRRFFSHQEFDICEISLASYLSARSKPEEYSITAIPAFVNKKFRHSFFYKNRDAGIDDPSDLAGKKVGIQSWQTTANVWVRGIAQEHYGLDLADVQWYRRREDDVEIALPDRFDVQKVPGKQEGDAVEEPKDLQDMLFSGELDAAMDPSGSLFHAVTASDSAELMFSDPHQEETEYYEQTGIHPPMHVVAVREEVVEEHPWVPVSIYDAFCAARDRCLEQNESPGSNTSITWAHLHLLEQQRILGENVWEYGLTKKTSRELEKFIEYATDQGLTSREFDPEELFADSTLDK